MAIPARADYNFIILETLSHKVLAWLWQLLPIYQRSNFLCDIKLHDPISNAEAIIAAEDKDGLGFGVVDAGVAFDGMGEVAHKLTHTTISWILKDSAHSLLLIPAAYQIDTLIRLVQNTRPIFKTKWQLIKHLKALTFLDIGKIKHLHLI